MALDVPFIGVHDEEESEAAENVEKGESRLFRYLGLGCSGGLLDEDMELRMLGSKFCDVVDVVAIGGLGNGNGRRERIVFFVGVA